MKKTDILHFSYTPLAGSPVQTVKALNKYTDFSARLVVLNPFHYGQRVFENDIDFSAEKELVFSLLEECKIIHLHHYFDLENNDFGINFKDFEKKGKKIIRQFHSSPFFIAKKDKNLAKEVINSKIPQLVIAQFHERYYPKAHLVPQIIPINDEEYKPCTKREKQVCFTPSVLNRGFYGEEYDFHWDTKGFPETKEVFKQLQEEFKDYKFLTKNNISIFECLELKKKSLVCIDELITGSYHRSGLEALSMGVSTLCYLDKRTEFILKSLTGCDEIPFVNCNINNAGEKITELLKNPEILNKFSENSRKWMQNYFSDPKMIQIYVQEYKNLLEFPELFEKNRFEKDKKFQILCEKSKTDFENLEKTFYTQKIANLTKKYANKRIFLYGYGKFAQNLLKNYDFSALNISGIFEKNISEEKTENGYKIFPSSKIIPQNPDVVLITVAYYQPVLEELQNFAKANNLSAEIGIL